MIKLKLPLVWQLLTSWLNVFTLAQMAHLDSFHFVNIVSHFSKARIKIMPVRMDLAVGVAQSPGRLRWVVNVVIHCYSHMWLYNCRGEDGALPSPSY